MTWPRMNPPNDRLTRLLEDLRLGPVARRDEPEQEGLDPLAVGDHVQRQDDDQQQVADRAEARDRELLERRRELDGVLADVVEERRGLRRAGRPGEAEAVQALLPGREDRRAGSPGAAAGSR